jgi:uncharacterized repeat protein (TIGR01451 family)
VVVTNTGNVDLSGVVVTDSQGNILTGGSATLGAGLSETLTGTHTVTQADLDAGSIVNTASVTATNVVVDADDTQTVTTLVDQHPDLALTKSFLTTPTTAGDPANTADHVGQVINYTVVVTNTGNVDLSGVVVTDSQGNILTGGSATLGAGLSETLTGTHTVTQADLDAGSIVNTASVTATNVVVDADDTQTVTTLVDQHPDLALTKSFLTTPTTTGDPANTADHVGQVINYTVVVTNTGNVDLSGVVVTDSQGNILTGGSATLGAGLSETLTGTHTVTQADLDAGSIVNTASVTATNVVVDADDTQTVTTTIDQHGPTESGTASLTVQEAALDTTKAGLDLAAGLVMGSNPSSTLETATSTGLTFTAGTSAITGMAFGTNLAGISVTGVVASASFFWEIVGGVLIGHLSTTHTATAADPIAIELALSGTEIANPGATAAPTITATLTDAFPDAGTTSATVNGIQVVATDGSAAHATVSGNVSVTVIDDTPSIGAIANAIMPSVSLTDVHGTWAPVFGADGVANQQPNPNGAFPTIPYGAILPAGTAAITIALPGQGSPVGTTTDPLGHTENVYSVAETANNGSGTFTYNIFEYSFYNPATQTAEVVAFGDAALTQPFFTLSMNADGTYVFDLESNSLLSSETFSVSGGTPNGNGEFVEVNTSGVGAYGSGAIPAPSSAFPLIIDGFTSTDTNPLDHRVFKDTNGFGIDQFAAA